ncbi:unnamed protein product [Mycena citricolor]|uniref:Glycoside hydrolase family 28 protein n=1 Tax=Mycena citricolor TaxID=2018698 RepID=A0AAD2Q329_9AGAR|nr:unnamed protein product [Mycena citricolor]
MSIRSSLLSFVVLAAFVSAAPSQTDTAKRATCTVNSVASASGLSSCTDVVIEAFTVPAGDTITIAAASASGPLITFDTDNINFNGGNNKIDGNGALYWDGQGTNGGSFKPHPLVKFKGYGTFSSVTVLNTPAQAISVGTTDTSTIQQVTVDNSAGASLGHNTDGFDISADSVTVSQCQVTNQDDCVAVNSGDSVLIENTTCTGGHGISIGSSCPANHDELPRDGQHGQQQQVRAAHQGRRGRDERPGLGGDVLGASGTSFAVEHMSADHHRRTEHAVWDQRLRNPHLAELPDRGRLHRRHRRSHLRVGVHRRPTTLAVDSTAYSVVVNCGACSGTWDWSELDVTSAGDGHQALP